MEQEHKKSMILLRSKSELKEIIKIKLLAPKRVSGFFTNMALLSY